MLFVRFAGSSSHQMSNEKVKTSGDKEPGGDEGKKEEKEEGGDDPGGEEGGEVSEEAKKKLEEKLKAYVRRRKFRFVHHFAGPRDPLGAEIHRVAKKRDLNVEVIAVEKDWGDDLCADEPYNTHLRWAREGLIDGFHSGFIPLFDVFASEVQGRTKPPGACSHSGRTLRKEFEQRATT